MRNPGWNTSKICFSIGDSCQCYPLYPYTSSKILGPILALYSSLICLKLSSEIRSSFLLNNMHPSSRFLPTLTCFRYPFFLGLLKYPICSPQFQFYVFIFRFQSLRSDCWSIQMPILPCSWFSAPPSFLIHQTHYLTWAYILRLRSHTSWLAFYTPATQ